MTDIMHDSHRASLFGRLGRFLIAISETAVAIHYHAPWQDEAMARSAAGKVRDSCAV